MWACDFLPITDALFRPLYAFFVIALGSRRVVHVGVTRHPTDAWVARQLREATPFEQRPRFLIRDKDAKYGPRFDHLATASGIRVLRTPVRAPRANTTCERFLGSVRMSCTSIAPGPIKASARRSRREQGRCNRKKWVRAHCWLPDPGWSPARLSSCRVTDQLG